MEIAAIIAAARVGTEGVVELINLIGRLQAEGRNTTTEQDLASMTNAHARRLLEQAEWDKNAPNAGT
jgi:hypothetical protein